MPTTVCQSVILTLMQVLILQKDIHVQTAATIITAEHVKEKKSQKHV
jgi:hypothetical protein